MVIKGFLVCLLIFCCCCCMTVMRQELGQPCTREDPKCADNVPGSMCHNELCKCNDTYFEEDAICLLKPEKPDFYQHNRGSTFIHIRRYVFRNQIPANTTLIQWRAVNKEHDPKTGHEEIAWTRERYTLRNLTAGVLYEIKMQSKTGRRLSNSTAKRLSTIPADPVPVLTHASSSSLTIAWDQAGVATEGYRVNVNLPATITRQANGTTIHLTGLLPNTTYTVGLQAFSNGLDSRLTSTNFTTLPFVHLTPSSDPMPTPVIVLFCVLILLILGVLGYCVFSMRKEKTKAEPVGETNQGSTMEKL
ncbi:unnamed protein product [Owenia fusiformis]|uniref:Uncharacterized protein n=1 Tax=Owenia fusiformis TaxID=6347 RepID=A0A8J1TD42_OWEFU|nr:unnamed protein product [Owenia fusiformis]